MPRHIIAIEVECDHPEFDGDEALEFVASHMDIATDSWAMSQLGYSSMGRYISSEGDAVEVDWYV